MRKPVPEFDPKDQQLLKVYEDLPLWSAPFGLALLEKFRFTRGMNVLDVGFGAGFPMLELAQRLGESCRVYGLDPWTAGVDHARAKAAAMQISNVEMIEGVAEQMPFTDAYFDAVVSNNGINNVSDQNKAVAECARVCKPGAQFLLTVNLPETMKEFYRVYEQTLSSLGKIREIERLKAHIDSKRKPLSFISQLLELHGFSIVSVKEESFTLRYLDGSSLLNHYFIRLAFVEPWQSIPEPNDIRLVFDRLEENLNSLAKRNGELCLTVPFACFNCRKL